MKYENNMCPWNLPTIKSYSYCNSAVLDQIIPLELSAFEFSCIYLQSNSIMPLCCIYN